MSTINLPIESLNAATDFLRKNIESVFSHRWVGVGGGPGHGATVTGGNGSRGCGGGEGVAVGPRMRMEGGGAADISATRSMEDLAAEMLAVALRAAEAEGYKISVTRE